MKIHASFVTVATFGATVIAPSTPVYASDDGHSNNQRRVRNKYNKKHSKKQNIKKEEICTMDNFVGEYKYINCESVVTNVEIMCDNDDDGLGENAAKCEYNEYPLNNDAEDFCFVHGSFDPVMHINKDLARAGVCQLDFVSLTDFCADVSHVGFGMKAEVDTATGHDTSMLLLRFSNDGGAVYYNEEEPRETVFLHHHIPPGRKLERCASEMYRMMNYSIDNMTSYKLAAFATPLPP